MRAVGRDLGPDDDSCRGSPFPDLVSLYGSSGEITLSGWRFSGGRRYRCRRNPSRRVVYRLWQSFAVFFRCKAWASWATSALIETRLPFGPSRV